MHFYNDDIHYATENIDITVGSTEDSFLSDLTTSGFWHSGALGYVHCANQENNFFDYTDNPDESDVFDGEFRGLADLMPDTFQSRDPDQYGVGDNTYRLLAGGAPGHQYLTPYGDCLLYTSDAADE